MVKLLIKDLKNAEPIKDALRICRKKVGSTHDIDPEENQIMIDFIKKRLGSIYPSEIIDAFDMAIDGRFEYIKPADLAPLKSRFTQAFLSQIMNPYLSYRAEKNRSQQRTEQIEQEEKPIDWTYFLNKYEETKQGVYTFNGMEWLYYQHLEKLGVEIMSVEDKKKLFERVKSETPRNLKENEDKYLWRVKKECRRIAFKEFILNCIIEDVDIKQKLSL